MKMFVCFQHVHSCLYNDTPGLRMYKYRRRVTMRSSLFAVGATCDVTFFHLCCVIAIGVKIAWAAQHPQNFFQEVSVVVCSSGVRPLANVRRKRGSLRQRDHRLLFGARGQVVVGRWFFRGAIYNSR